MKICPKCSLRRPNIGKCPICLRRKAREKYRKQKENGKVKPRSAEQRKRAAERSAQYYKQNKPKFHARSVVNQAFLRGEKWIANDLRHHPNQGALMFNPKFCPTCGNPDSVSRIEAHHWQGYENRNWFEIFQCCQKCHNLIHVLIGEALLQGLDAQDGFRQFLKEKGYGKDTDPNPVESSDG